MSTKSTPFPVPSRSTYGEASGIRFDQLMDKLVDLALKRKRESSMKTVSYDQNIFNLGKGLKGGKMGAKQP